MLEMQQFLAEHAVIRNKCDCCGRHDGYEMANEIPHKYYLKDGGYAIDHHDYNEGGLDVYNTAGEITKTFRYQTGQ